MSTMNSVSNGPSNSYYISRRAKLLRGFDRAAKRAGRSLARRYDGDFAREVLAQSRVEFDRLIPQLPYIGGRENYFTPVIVINGWIIALFRAMKSRGKSARETASICAQVAQEFFNPIPRVILYLGGRIAFTQLVKKALKKQATLSQERRYPEDFVYAFRDGGKDEWALEFTECAVNKLYQAQAAQELKPYCNFFDVIYSRLMGMGVDARETIGLGCDKCVLSYRRGRDTIIPERLRGLVPAAGADN